MELETTYLGIILFLLRFPFSLKRNIKRKKREENTFSHVNLKLLFKVRSKKKKAIRGSVDEIT